MARHQPRFVSDDSTEQYSWFRRVIDNLLAAFHMLRAFKPQAILEGWASNAYQQELLLLRTLRIEKYHRVPKISITPDGSYQFAP